MRDLKKILAEEIGMRLNHLEYKRIETLEEEAKLFLEDEFEIIEIQEDFFAMLVRRHVYCDPEDTMDIVVEFEIARHLSDEYSEDLRTYDIENEVREDVDFFIGYNMSRASALISNITASFGLAPLVTQPLFTSIENDE